MGISLIAGVAAYLGISCEASFSMLATRAYGDDRGKARWNQIAMEEFAKASCSTNNPDAFWLIAKVESDFTFDIVAINAGGKTAKVLRGRRGLELLTKDSARKKRNMDIGVLQINWMIHGSHFENGNRLNMFSPAKQVSYVVDEMMPGLVRGCGNDWVLCYHNQKNDDRKKDYAKKIRSAMRLLAKVTKKIIEDKKAASASSADKVPAD